MYGVAVPVLCPLHCQPVADVLYRGEALVIRAYCLHESLQLVCELLPSKIIKTTKRRLFSFTAMVEAQKALYNFWSRIVKWLFCSKAQDFGLLRSKKRIILF